MGRPERVVKWGLRSFDSAGDFVFVSDILALTVVGQRGRGKPRPYSLRALRNEDSAKKKNNMANATAAAISQWAVSRFQERRAAFSHVSPRIAKAAPTISRKSCFRARQKR